MFKQMKKRIKNEKGLTLIELLAVIVILAIISAIAIPAIGNIIENTRFNTVKADAISVINATNLYYTEDPAAVTGVTVTTLKADGYLDNSGKISNDATISKALPRELTTTETTGIEFSTGKFVKFTGATIDEINVHKTKGSKLTALKVISIIIFSLPKKKRSQSFFRIGN